MVDYFDSESDLKVAFFNYTAEPQTSDAQVVEYFPPGHNFEALASNNRSIVFLFILSGTATHGA